MDFLWGSGPNWQLHANDVDLAVSFVSTIMSTQSQKEQRGQLTGVAEKKKIWEKSTLWHM